MQQSDHKLIDQVDVRPVGGIRAQTTGLIMPNHCFSRFCLSTAQLLTLIWQESNSNNFLLRSVSY